MIWSIPVPDDNCGVTSLTETSTGGPYHGEPLVPGTYEIEYTAADAAGNDATCSFTIVVEDDANPLLVCQDDITIDTDEGVCTWAAPAGSLNPLLAVDNCPGYTLTHNINNNQLSAFGVVPAGTLLGLGVNTIYYELEDGGGNIVSCSFTVTVEDNEDPVILDCPADPDPICGSGPVSWVAPTADDNCGIASFSSNYDPNDVFPVGSTEVTYTAVDNSGNTVTCTFTVVVYPVPTPALNAVPEPVCASPSTNSGAVGNGNAAEGIIYALAVPANGIPYTSIDWTITGGDIVGGGDNAMFVEVVWGAGPNGTIAVTVTDANGCSAMMTPVNVTIYAAPEANSVILMACPQYPGSFFADFTLADAEDPDGVQNASGWDVDGDGLPGVSGGVTVSYHLSQFDADNDLNPISDEPFNSNSKTIYVRIESLEGCVQVRAIWLTVKDTPLAPTTEAYTVCADEPLDLAALRGRLGGGMLSGRRSS
ncbi:MAG: HYR domain-containing protein [Saprospirales bacterium]|nr:HYR domain-containing protein [Saprospirales bacterium]